MKKRGVYILSFLFAPIFILQAQQISIDNSQQPNELIQNLVGDNCVTASNVSSPINGNINNLVSYGSFNRGSTSFPLNSGIILSTGGVNSAANLFIGEDLSEGEINWGTDQDVNDILGIDQTLNATVLEFDFTAANNFIGFKYLFASDEYQQEFPCNFEDVFAILIKPIGSNEPYVNIAVIPNTTTEISTNTIHTNINGFCPPENEDFFDGYNIGNTNFNGRTEVLTATGEVNPGESYHIKFIIADHIDQRFDSAVFIESDSFGSAIDLGPDQSICGSELTLDADVGNPNANYSWFLNGVQIAGETNNTLQVTQTGTYNVEIDIPLLNGTCSLGDTINVEVIPFLDAGTFEDIYVCDPYPSDGVADFDFSTKNEEVLATLSSENYTISYHTTLENAQNNIDPIIGLYQNTELNETIFVRIESLDGSCLQLGLFNIIVNLSPNIGEIEGLKICNGYFLDGILFEDIRFFDVYVANFEFNRIVSYHLTESDALNNENEIDSSFDIPDMSENIYARISDIYSNCFSIKPLPLIYFEGLNFDDQKYVISLCGFEPYSGFSLTPIRAQVEAVFGDVSITFHRTYSDALTQNNVILGDFLESNQTPYTGRAYMYVLPNGSECGTVAEIELFINLPRNLFGDERSIYKCDDMSNDGSLSFDLNEVITELSQGFDVNVTLYETEEDQFFDDNPLDPNIPLQVSNYSQEIYLTAEFEGCYNFSKVVLNVNDTFSIEPQVVESCGEVNPEDGTTTVYIDTYEAVIAQISNNSFIRFYENEEDAQNEENILTGAYNIEGNSKEFFVRVTDIISQCFTITTLTVNLSQSVVLNEIQPIVICDDDQDGNSIINLESLIPQISNDNNDLTFTFYESNQNAIDSEFSISNPENFIAQTQDIFVRAERDGLGCFSITSINVSIYSNPQLGSISDFINCEIDASQPSDFFFINKDEEIINGQTDMQVLYFETENDAINRSNPIDKTIAYQNTSNLQTVYVRIENEAENSCYRTAPMQIEVKQAPIYNNPTDIPVCGTNGDGPYLVDLGEKIDEITDNSPTNLDVTFYNTPLNASLGINSLPLSYTTTNNPEAIYIRVLNTDSGCYEITSLNVNVLDLPEVNYGQSLTACGNNYNSNLQWDLTEIELDILDGRQYNIDFTYYRTEFDSENGTNPIPNPEAYNNTNNPETIYAKVRNASTGCFITVPFDLNINLPPQINDFEVYSICENEDNSLNLTDINSVLLENNFNVIVSYHNSETDAQNNENPLATDYNYIENSQILYARVEYSTTGCYGVYPFQLEINSSPIAYQPNDLVACDDNFDNLLIFDLSQQNSEIIGNQDPTEFTISYHYSQINAIQNLEPFNLNYLAFNTQIIYARIENNTTGCYDITQFSTIINPLPNINIEDQVICLDNLPLLVSANTNNITDLYLWSTGATTPEVEITEIGTYWVTVTTEFGCENTRTFNVSESEAANIEFTETVDFSDPNNITVTISGIGNYLYQLDDNEPQDSNVFENVGLGYHTVTIIDLNGCSEVTEEVLVIDAPKHMSPNNDGDFDTWHISGVETLPGTIIYIFDRYGKLITKLGANTPGWDGTYNGNKMPAGDYWFLAEVQNGEESFEVKGHFALRR